MALSTFQEEAGHQSDCPPPQTHTCMDTNTHAHTAGERCFPRKCWCLQEAGNAGQPKAHWRPSGGPLYPTNLQDGYVSRMKLNGDLCLEHVQWLVNTFFLSAFLLSLPSSHFLWLPCLLSQGCQPEKTRLTLRGVMADSTESGIWVKDAQREWSSGGDPPFLQW